VWRGIVPWDKTEASRPQKGRPRAQCEYLVWGSKGPLEPWEDAPCAPGVVRLYKRASDRLHIAQKHIGVNAPLISCVVPGGLVLDPFAGSGEHGLEVLESGRRYHGIEVVPEWAEMARSRLAVAADGAQPVAGGAAAQELLFGGGGS
jgi:site-specific DNA-methyltransferase (adenine-specific)